MQDFGNGQRVENSMFVIYKFNKKRINVVLLLFTFILTVILQSTNVFAYNESDYSAQNIQFYDPRDTTCASVGSSVSSLTGKDNREKIWNYLTAKGLSLEQAAGVLGNIQTESGGTFSPTIQEYSQAFGRGGYGIVQWTNYKELPGGRRDSVVAQLKTQHPDLMSKYYNIDYSTQGKSFTGIAEGFVPKSASSGVLMPVADNDALLLTELNFLYDESTNRVVSSSAIKNSTGVSRGETEWDALKKQTTIAEASNIWVYSFEVPADIDNTAVARIANAQKIFDIYSTSASGESCTVQAGSTTIDQANIYADSTAVGCAAGTDDAGVGEGYYKGTKVNIRLCSLPNTIDQNHGGQPGRVNSRVSGAFLALTNGLYADSVSSSIRRDGKLLISDSFRTMAEQRAVCIANPGVPCAKAGFSNHQMGIAIDFRLIWGYGKARPVGDPIYDWLTANAGQYGIRQLASEGWHWEPNAAK